jgi:hypothetical protein
VCQNPIEIPANVQSEALKELSEGNPKPNLTIIISAFAQTRQGQRECLNQNKKLKMVHE